MRERLERRVYPLRELDDFEVADHNPDVRGWDVYSADGLEIGAVEELLVDPAAKKVRYLAVDLPADDKSRAARRQVVVPIGAARLREDSDDVVLDTMKSSDVAALPAYRPEAFDDAYETDVRTRFGYNADVVSAQKDDRTTWYDNDLYDDSRFYGGRRR